MTEPSALEVLQTTRRALADAWVHSDQGSSDELALATAHDAVDAAICDLIGYVNIDGTGTLRKLIDARAS